MQDVDFTFQSVVGFFEELAAHFVPLITVLLFNTATPATDKHAAGHDVLPVVILKLPAIKNGIRELLLVLFLLVDLIFATRLLILSVKAAA